VQDGPHFRRADRDMEEKKSNQSRSTAIGVGRWELRRPHFLAAVRGVHPWHHSGSLSTMGRSGPLRFRGDFQMLQGRFATCRGPCRRVKAALLHAGSPGSSRSRGMRRSRTTALWTSWRWPLPWATCSCRMDVHDLHPRGGINEKAGPDVLPRESRAASSFVARQSPCRLAHSHTHRTGWRLTVGVRNTCSAGPAITSEVRRVRSVRRACPSNEGPGTANCQFETTAANRPFDRGRAEMCGLEGALTQTAGQPRLFISRNPSANWPTIGSPRHTIAPHVPVQALRCVALHRFRLSMALIWLWLVAMKFLPSLRRPASQRSSPTIMVEAEDGGGRPGSMGFPRGPCDWMCSDDEAGGKKGGSGPFAPSDD
jgi:hypothetical protein